MKKHILFALLLFLMGISLYAQEYYIVNDPDGSVNMRYGAGTNHDVYSQIANKTIVRKNKEKQIEKGWIPVVSNGSEGYVFEDRLIAIKDKTIVSKLKKLDDPSERKYLYAISLDIPELVAVSDDDCELGVYDLKRDKTILESDAPVCLVAIPGDTLSFYFTSSFWEYGSKVPSSNFRPVFITYNIYKNDGGFFDYYTEMTPEPYRVSDKEAKRMVEKAKRLMTNTRHNSDTNTSTYDKYQELTTAYFSGEEEAKKMLWSSPCDASLCHEKSIYLELIDAYDRRRKE